MVCKFAVSPSNHGVKKACLLFWGVWISLNNVPTLHRFSARCSIDSWSTECMLCNKRSTFKCWRNLSWLQDSMTHLLLQNLWEWMHITFFPSFIGETTFIMTSCLLPCTPSFFRKCVQSKQKEYAPQGVRSYL